MLRNSLFALAVMAAGLGPASAGFTQPAPIVQTAAPRAVRPQRRGTGLLSGWLQHSYLRHGPSAAQVKRAARKARGVRQHKQRVRG
jgi:hypothetical protein